MSDHYLNEQGQIAFTEGTSDIVRIFKPIAVYGTITVYEEQSAKALAPSQSAPLDNWDC